METFARRLFLHLAKMNKPSENKTPKTTIRLNWRYAIGEIAIVSIGILLAFQLNAWKDDRSNRDHELNSLNMLVTEMQKDSAKFYTHYKNAVQHKEDALFILQSINSDNPNALVDSMIAAYRRCGSYSPIILHRSAFLMMTAQGTLSLIEDQTIRNAIYNYYDQTHELAEEFASIQKHMVNNVLPKVHEQGIIDDERVLLSNGLQIYYHPERFVNEMLKDNNRGKIAMYMRSQNEIIGFTHLNRMRNRELLKKLREYISKL